jgi:site-specific DNA-methyltransferase (adenine-specific)
MRLELGDCLEVLKNIPDNSVDSIVTDPPYGLSFMNKKWDYDVPSTDIWIECLRVLKPGGHLLSFSGSRTYHRMVVRIEDAGFEIRDQIMWVYGSGFPKSHNIGKAVDKLQGNEREVVGEVTTQFKIDNYEQNIYGKYKPIMNEKGYRVQEITKGPTEWEGWGTALKPAHEPIVMARKPLSEKTVAENVLRWGTGGINIDESRIPLTSQKDLDDYRFNMDGNLRTTKDEGEKLGMYDGGWKVDKEQKELPEGRWPANIIFDEEAGIVLDQQSGISTGKVGMTQQSSPNNIYNGFKSTGDTKVNDGITDKGGASRFFYCPKTSKKDRDEGLDEFEEKAQRQSSGGSRDFNARCANCGKKFIGSPETICACDNPITDNTVFKKKNNHPTVKPTELMLYLIKLVTPVNGVVLDPFMGSGSTGKGATRGGFDFIGIEREEEYIKIAEARIKNEMK